MGKEQCSAYTQGWEEPREKVSAHTGVGGAQEQRQHTQTARAPPPLRLFFPAENERMRLPAKANTLEAHHAHPLTVRSARAHCAPLCADKEKTKRVTTRSARHTHLLEVLLDLILSHVDPRPPVRSLGDIVGVLCGTQHRTTNGGEKQRSAHHFIRGQRGTNLPASAQEFMLSQSRQYTRRKGHSSTQHRLYLVSTRKKTHTELASLTAATDGAPHQQGPALVQGEAMHTW